MAGAVDAFHVSANGVAYMALAIPRPHLALPTGLTLAEESVAMLLVAGLTNTEIAEARGSAVRTVANQVAAILAKAGASSRREFVASCRRLGP